jgi:hypothetical protein
VQNSVLIAETGWDAKRRFTRNPAKWNFSIFQIGEQIFITFELFKIGHVFFVLCGFIQL